MVREDGKKGGDMKYLVDGFDVWCLMVWEFILITFIYRAIYHSHTNADYFVSGVICTIFLCIFIWALFTVIRDTLRNKKTNTLD